MIFFFPFIFVVSYTIYFYIVMLFVKDDGAGSSRACNIWYSKVTEGQPATPIPQIAEAVQQLSFGYEARPPVPLAFWTLSVDVQAMVDDLQTVRTNLARLLGRSNQKVKPKTVFTTYGFSDRSSARK